jgi:hypothetical protein
MLAMLLSCAEPLLMKYSLGVLGRHYRNFRLLKSKAEARYWFRGRGRWRHLATNGPQKIETSDSKLGCQYEDILIGWSHAEPIEAYRGSDHLILEHATSYTL